MIIICQAISSALPYSSSLASLVLAWNNLSGGVQNIAWALTQIAREGGARDDGPRKAPMCLTHIDLTGTNLMAEVCLIM